MNKSELITAIHKLHPYLELKQLKEIIELIFNNLVEGLKEGKRIEVRGFGALSRRKRRVQLNFPTDPNAEIKFDERYSMYFRMGKDFFDSLNSLS